MEATTRPAPSMTAVSGRPVEQFDINVARVTGRVQRSWSRSGHTFLRLAITALVEDAEGEEPATRTHFITGRIENGMIHNLLVTLMPGDLVTVTGYLADAPYDESIREFLSDAKQAGRVDTFPNPEAWDQVRIKRVNTRFEILELVVLADEGEQDMGANSAQVEGVVATTWRRRGDLYARIAIYDPWTPVMDGVVGKNGHPRRKPHYITVVFPEGRVAGRAVALNEKNRIRVIGEVSMRLYRETLRELLLHAGKISLLVTDIPDGDIVGQIKAVRSATYVVARSAQIFGAYNARRKPDD